MELTNGDNRALFQIILAIAAAFLYQAVTAKLFVPGDQHPAHTIKLHMIRPSRNPRVLRCPVTGTTLSVHVLVREESGFERFLSAAGRK